MKGCFFSFCLSSNLKYSVLKRFSRDVNCATWSNQSRRYKTKLKTYLLVSHVSELYIIKPSWMWQWQCLFCTPWEVADHMYAFAYSSQSALLHLYVAIFLFFAFLLWLWLPMTRYFFELWEICFANNWIWFKKYASWITEFGSSFATGNKKTALKWKKTKKTVTKYCKHFSHNWLENKVDVCFEPPTFSFLPFFRAPSISGSLQDVSVPWNFTIAKD